MYPPIKLKPSRGSAVKLFTLSFLDYSKRFKGTVILENLFV